MMKINTLKRTFLFITAICFTANVARSQATSPKINEYSCANTSTLTDGFGNTPDWFELYNTKNFAINISGFYLSNDPTNLAKWQFPINTSIAANGHLVVFASGQDTVITALAEYHTNFDLLQTKPQKIIVSDISGNVVDSLTLKQNQRNDSWGRVPDGGGNWKLFSGPTYVPTPGAINPFVANSSYINYKAKPIFSIPAGTYGSTSVKLTSPQTNVKIRYTTDGSNPKTSGTAITAASPVSLTIASTSVIRAVCVDFPTAPAVVTYDTSFIETNTYFLAPNNAFTFPVVSVCIDTTKLFAGSTSGTDATFEYFDKNKQFVFESFGFTGVPIDEPNWTNKQRSFDYSAEDEYGYAYTNKNQFFTDANLGASQRIDFTKLVFKSAELDNFPAGQGSPSVATQMPVHMRDAFSQSYAFRKNFNLDGRHYQPIIMFINGKYWGVYELREEFDKEYTDYYYKQSSIMDLLQSGGAYVNGPTAAEQNDWQNVYNFIVMNSMNNPVNYAMVDSMMNLKSFIDYMIYNTYAVNANFDNMNMEWRGTDLSAAKHKWNFGMLNMDDTWGLNVDNAVLGNTGPTSDPCDYTNAFPIGNSAQAHPFMLMKLMTNDTFKSAYINRYADLLNTTLSCDSVMDHFNYFRTFMTPEMKRHIGKWTSTNVASPYYSNPNDSLADWNRNMDNMKAWIQRRCTYIDTAISLTTSCYNVTGPYTFCLDISPASTGSIQFNSLNHTNFMYTGQYFGNVTMTAVATPIPNYYFDHWETTGFTLADSLIKRDSITWLFDSISCLKAIFKLKEPYNLTGTPLVPTGFSPNGDGNNDILNVYGTLNATKFEIEIYNRWGQTVFKSNDKTVGWDGKFNGTDAPVGVYAYRYIVTIDGTEVSKKGNVTLIR